MTSGADARRSERLDVAFISSNFTWGGSEDLWSETAAELASRGHRVTVYKNRLQMVYGNMERLKQLGVRRTELAKFPLLPNQVYSLAAQFFYPLSIGYQAVRLYACLRLRRRPALVVMSQGGNHDGWLLTSVCRRLKLDYVMICQKATDLYWPLDRWRSHIRANYEAALHAFFVSEHNLKLTEEQLAMPLTRASVARNPFKVRWDGELPWPASDEPVRLACIGRLYPMEKGQDLLLRVLAMPKWRERPVTLTFFGAGEQSESLEGMAKYHGLANVRFAGHSTDISAVWAEHHALVLPSRAEGLPLVIVEAMLSGRVAIATDVAGNAEAIEDEVTGFLAAAPTEAALDEAMERAWQRRAEWPQIGKSAAEAMRKLVPAQPASVLADQLLKITADRKALEGRRAPASQVQQPQQAKLQ